MNSITIINAKLVKDKQIYLEEEKEDGEKIRYRVEYCLLRETVKGYENNTIFPIVTGEIGIDEETNELVMTVSSANIETETENNQTRYE